MAWLGAVDCSIRLIFWTWEPPPPLGWHQRRALTQVSRSNARQRSNTRHSIERSEISYFFEKPKANIVPYTAIVFDRWWTRFLGIQFFTYNPGSSQILDNSFSILDPKFIHPESASKNLRIPDTKFFHSGSASKNLSILAQNYGV